jgi:copper homeostasis protein (lipoprotein)
MTAIALLRSSATALLAAALVAAAPAAIAADAKGKAASPTLDGPYAGTLPCADCEGIVTELSLERDRQGAVVGYRLRQTYLTTRPGEREFSSAGPARGVQGIAGNPKAAGLRLEGARDDGPLLLLRLSPSVLELLDRDGRRIDSSHDHRLVLDRNARAPEARPQRELFAGTLRRHAGQASRPGWQFLPCRTRDVREAVDVSPENSISAVLSDLGFDRRDGMYIEAFGRRDGGRLLFESLNRTGVEMRCPSPGKDAERYVALGHEPSWSLRGSADATRWVQPGSTLQAPSTAPSWQWSHGDRRPAARLDVDTEALTLRARFVPRICRDSMADAAYGWQASIEQRRPETRTLSGCAYLGAPPRP